jgi:hypothetical protein
VKRERVARCVVKEDTDGEILKNRC